MRGSISRYRLQCRVASWRRRTARNEQRKPNQTKPNQSRTKQDAIQCEIEIEIDEIDEIPCRFRVPDLDLRCSFAPAKCVHWQHARRRSRRNEICFFVSNSASSIQIQFALPSIENANYAVLSPARANISLDVCKRRSIFGRLLASLGWPRVSGRRFCCHFQGSTSGGALLGYFFFFCPVYFHLGLILLVRN